MTLYSLVYDGEEGDNNYYCADWNPDEGKWVSSKKEYLGNRWEFNETLSYDAYNAILNHFRLTSDKVSIENIITMSPRQLYDLSFQDPKSCTLGDKRAASEVD